MDFNEILEEVEGSEGFTLNPYASKRNGEWVSGGISINFLNEHFGHLKTVEEMINATESEGLKLYFTWLRDKGILN